MFKIFVFFVVFLYFVFQAVNNDSKITEGKVIDDKLQTNSIDQSQYSPNGVKCLQKVNKAYIKVFTN